MQIAELAEKIKIGDADAFGLLFKNHYPRLINYCKLFIRERDLADDLVQETFLLFWEKRTQLDVTKSIESLLFVSLRNRCLNHLQHSNYIRANIEQYKKEVQTIQFLSHIDYLGEEEVSLEEKLVSEVHKAMDNLPARCRQVFHLSKFEGIKNRDIARQLGISVKAVEKHLTIAKKRIAIQITQHYPLGLILFYYIFNSDS